jgi:hypothetical protein
MPDAVELPHRTSRPGTLGEGVVLGPEIPVREKKHRRKFLQEIVIIVFYSGFPVFPMYFNEVSGKKESSF